MTSNVPWTSSFAFRALMEKYLKLTRTGSIVWYTGWDILNFESSAASCSSKMKNLFLKEVNNVFDIGNCKHAKYSTERRPWGMS